MQETAQSIIDSVYDIGLQNGKTKNAEYAVFYSAPRFRPDLMLFVLNPGGGAISFSGNKEAYVTRRPHGVHTVSRR